MSAKKLRNCVRCHGVNDSEGSTRLCVACKSVGIERVCDCGETFNDHNGNLYSCYECRAKVAREYYQKKQAPVRRDLMHGMVPGTIDRMIVDLGGVCPICNRPGELVVDHDRSCCDYMPTVGRPTCGQCWRGMICRSCNAGMGQFGDDPDLLMAAVAYLLQSRNVLELAASED